MHYWPVPKVHSWKKVGLDALSEAQSRGELIGQYHAKTVESSLSGCIKRYGVILYHKVTGIAFTIKAMLLPSSFTPVTAVSLPHWCFQYAQLRG